MKGPFSMLVISVFFVSTKEQCPTICGSNGYLNVICEPPRETSTTAEPLTTVTTTLHFSHASSSFATSIESTSVANSNENTDVTTSSNTTTVGFNSLSLESTQDVPENMMYIIAGSAAGGAIILVGLVVLVLVLINRTRSTINKNGSTEAGMARTNEVFDSIPELPNNPLYLTSQPVDELGYSSDQEKQLGLPPTDSKTKKKINPDYDVPPNNKPIAYGTSSMPVYAVPKKRSQDRTPEISSGDVYAEVCKPNRCTGKDPVRKRHEDGLLYMEVEQDTAVTKQTNTNDKNEITEGVCYAQIKHT
uniref:Uncharacterized protein n=1 Tax=Magallana gigas TaxID=29159 RepID=A0A8W8JD30_MAGGI